MPREGYITCFISWGSTTPSMSSSAGLNLLRAWRIPVSLISMAIILTFLALLISAPIVFSISSLPSPEKYGVTLTLPMRIVFSGESRRPVSDFLVLVR